MGPLRASLRRRFFELKFNKEKDPPIGRTVRSLVQVLRTASGNVLTLQ